MFMLIKSQNSPDFVITTIVGSYLRGFTVRGLYAEADGNTFHEVLW